MSLEARRYETVYILRQSVTDPSVVNDKIDSVIKKFDGEVETRDDWGVKELAYDVSGERSGRYVILNYKGNPGVVEEIERHFKISNDVIRFITVNLESDYDYTKVKKLITTTEEEGKRHREEKRKGREHRGGDRDHRGGDRDYRGGDREHRGDRDRDRDR